MQWITKRLPVIGSITIAILIININTSGPFDKFINVRRLIQHIRANLIRISLPSGIR